MYFLENGHTPAVPLNRARIGWEQVAVSASATSAETGFPAAAVLTDQTYERWRPASSPVTITVTFPEQDINFVGIGAHTLVLADSIALEVEINAAWVPITIDGDLEPDDAADEATLIEMSTKNATGVRLIIEYSNDAPHIGNIRTGQVLAMDRPFYQGHEPAKLSRDVVVVPSQSESGEWLGRSVRRRGKSTTMQWQNLPAQWYRDNFDAFAQHAVNGTFVVAWNPLQFPSDCFYGHTDTQIRPVNSGPRDLMSVSMSVQIYSTVG